MPIFQEEIGDAANTRPQASRRPVTDLTQAWG
jgi:hypothetical protein